MTESDLDQLKAMGFDPEKAAMAVRKTGSLANAIDWLDANSEKTIEEIQAADTTADQERPPEAPPEAKSLVCNECGKKFRGQAQAEWHASKTEHVDFSESTDEIAPLTEEEKKKKLADLRERLREKRAAQANEDLDAKKRNEQISRKKTKESQDLIEEMKVKEQLREAEKKKKEKQADIDAKARVKAKIAEQREEQRLKAERLKAERAGIAVSTEASAPAVPQKSTADYTETRLRLQTPQGNVQKSFKVETTLFEVAAVVSKEVGLEVESFTQSFPRKVFNKEFFGESLKDLKLVPSAALIVK